MARSKWALTLSAALLLLFTVSAAQAAVDITFFTGAWQSNAVQLSWETGSETEHSSFVLWRSTENLPLTGGRIDTTRATQVTTKQSPSPCGTSGQAYSHTDTTVGNAPAYYYYLESRGGCPGGSPNSTFHGNDQESGGLAVNNPAGGPTNTPQPTGTTAPANTSVPTGTTAPANTPVPTATLAPGQTPPTATTVPPATGTVPPSVTRAATTAAQATIPAQPTTAVQATAIQATAQAQPTSAAPNSVQPTVAIFGTVPADPNAPVAATVDPSGGAESDVTLATPDPSLPATGTPEAIAAANVTVSPVADSATGGDMDRAVNAATPTIGGPVFDGAAAGGTEEPLVADQSGDGLDRVIQGIVGLILLGVVGLVGFLGYSYAKNR